METFIKTSEDIRKYVSTAFNFSFSVVKPYVVKSERHYIKNILSNVLFENWATTQPTSGNALKVYELCREASANLAVLHYIPVGVVTVADHGITVSTSANTETASYGQILDLKRSLLEIANLAMDEALLLMENNQTDFPLWVSSDSYTVFKEYIVPSTSLFNRFFNIQNSRLTFIALQAYQLEIQSKIFYWMDSVTLGQIKNASSNLVELKAKEHAQRAQVNYTVSKAAESGVFLFKSTGMFTKYAELPVEKHHHLNEHQLKRLIASRNDAGSDAIKKLKQHIIDNPEVFTAYQEASNTGEHKIISGSSIVSF